MKLWRIDSLLHSATWWVAARLQFEVGSLLSLHLVDLGWAAIDVRELLDAGVEVRPAHARDAHGALLVDEDGSTAGVNDRYEQALAAGQGPQVLGSTEWP